MLIGVLGTQEFIIIFAGLLLLAVPVFVYKYGKNKGRLQEMEKRLKDRDGV